MILSHSQVFSLLFDPLLLEVRWCAERRKEVVHRGPKRSRIHSLCPSLFQVHCLRRRGNFAIMSQTSNDSLADLGEATPIDKSEALYDSFSQQVPHTWFRPSPSLATTDITPQKLSRNRTTSPMERTVLLHTPGSNSQPVHLNSPLFVSSIYYDLGTNAPHDQSRLATLESE